MATSVVRPAVRRRRRSRSRTYRRVTYLCAGAALLLVAAVLPLTPANVDRMRNALTARVAAHSLLITEVSVTADTVSGTVANRAERGFKWIDIELDLLDASGARASGVLVQIPQMPGRASTSFSVRNPEPRARTAIVRRISAK